jgi:hypothetical protein
MSQTRSPQCYPRTGNRFLDRQKGFGIVLIISNRTFYKGIRDYLHEKISDPG